MGRRQFRVLYREFLFRFVDRELLSSHATGDMSQLLLQVTTLLLVLSILFSAPALILDFGEPVVVRMLFTLSIEHFLIATTMLAVGLFAVFSWGSMFPSHQDVLVLGPLPVRAEMILLAKLAGVATVLGLVIFALHVVAGVVWPLVLYANDRAPLEPGAAWPLPFASAPRSWLRLFAAYWITMCAAGMFVFGTAMGVQGLAAALLPHRHFLRVSSLLQLTAFGVIIGTYFLQPMLVRPTTFYRVPASPSYWFLGLFQTLSGSTVFAPLARSAYVGLAVALAVAALAYALSYVRTLRRIAEQPDISPGVRRLRWLPAVGGQSQTAIVHFSLRTLARSAQHRVILAFYWGIGFALAAFAVKLPRPRRVAVDAVPNGWPENSLALLVSSLIMLGFTVLGARVAFALPRDVQATWIFRILPIRDALEYARPRRRALLLISVAPVWIATAIVFFSTWPWMPAAGHLAALAVAGAILTEVAVAGTATIPFTCSYLPGKSQFHIIAFLGLVLVLPLTFSAARFERDALQDGIAYAKMMGVLALTWIVVRYRTAWLEKAQGSQIEFDGKPADTPLTLGVWDSRF